MERTEAAMYAEQTDATETTPAPKRRSSILQGAENLLKYGRVHPTERDIQSHKKDKGSADPRVQADKDSRSRFVQLATY